MRGGGGGRGTQESFIRGGSDPRSKPLPFFIIFLTGKVTLLYAFRRKWYPYRGKGGGGGVGYLYSPF